MAKNRKKATSVGVKLIEELFPNTGNAARLAELWNKLSDKEFDAMMERFRNDEERLYVVLPTLNSPTFDQRHFLEFGKRHGLEFFHHVEMTDPDTGKPFITPIRYLIMQLPINRLQQLQEYKVSLPEDNYHVDELSGQVTGVSKGARFSFPELNVVLGKGHKIAAAEIIAVRGGNAMANRKLEYSIAMSGHGNAQEALAGTRGAKSTQTLAGLLRTVHLGTTLDVKG